MKLVMCCSFGSFRDSSAKTDFEVLSGFIWPCIGEGCRLAKLMSLEVTNYSQYHVFYVAIGES